MRILFYNFASTQTTQEIASSAATSHAQTSQNESWHKDATVALYRETGRSERLGGNQCRVTATLSPIINVSPSVRFVGGSGLRGSAQCHNAKVFYEKITKKRCRTTEQKSPKQREAHRTLPRAAAPHGMTHLANLTAYPQYHCLCTPRAS